MLRGESPTKKYCMLTIARMQLVLRYWSDPVNDHNILVATLWLVTIGFLLKGVVFGIASVVMIHQKGTSKLAHAVKRFFIVMTIQDIIFMILYGVGSYEAIDPRTRDIGIFATNLIRITGVVAIYSAAISGALFIYVLSKRVKVLIDYEELDRNQDQKWLKD
jgi:hypothetical protein